MRVLARTALWAGIIGVSVLPGLSNTSYPPYNIEYILASAACIILGILCNLISYIPLIRILLLLALNAFPIALYFGSFFFHSYTLKALALLLTLALTVLAYRRFEKALLLSGIVAYSQIITAAIATPSYILHLEEKQVAHDDKPSVIHILLDEHGSMAAFPPGTIPVKQLNKFQNEYVRRGFVVFSHAYTADAYTHRSLPRLFNANTESERTRFTRLKGGVIGKPDTEKAEITHASVLDTIGKERAIDMTQINYVNFEPALKKNPSVARNMTYSVRGISQSLGELPLYDRMILARSMIQEWLIRGLESRLAFTITNKLAWETTPPPLAIASEYMFKQMTQRLSCCGERGTYYFAHFLLPHKPYIYNENCKLLWITNWETGTHGPEKAFEQASCSKKHVFHLVDKLEESPALKDAVIIVHGDHGVRLDKTSDVSMYGSFLAVKIPGVEARIIDFPVRLDRFYKNLLENDFKTFNVREMLPSKDSPY